ncbi:MAG: prenyltransferase [Candidatus Aminicenantes bacterium]|nr:prenyltransferase [Candidatus Aminicenantes bacterium]
MKLKLWFLETRPNFLLLSVVLSFLGTSMAKHDGDFNLVRALLGFVGLLLCHISVNVLNDYFDYRSGIDLKTRRTPFSGGSGLLPSGALKPAHVLRFGVAAFLLAVPIGVYFVIVTGWLLLPLLIVAALCILLYTPLLTKIGWPEWSPGVGLGALPVLGAYFIQTGAYTLSAALASVPSGLLVHNLLLLNEFPDVEADKTAGRKTLPITIGKRKAAYVYSAFTVAVYVWIAALVAAGIMPVYCLLAFLTLGRAAKAIRGALHPDDPSRLLPAMGHNVLVILLTQLLLGIGYLLGDTIPIHLF